MAEFSINRLIVLRPRTVQALHGILTSFTFFLSVGNIVEKENGKHLTKNQMLAAECTSTIN